MAKRKPILNISAPYLEALAGRDPLVIQGQAPRRLQKLMQGLSESQLSRRPAPGKWSIKEVIGHLADHEVVYGFRLRCVAALERPQLAGYDENLFVTNLAVAAARTRDLFEAYAAARKANHALVLRLQKKAGPKLFERIGLHAERGPESFQVIVTRNAGHDVLHERQVERTRATVTSAPKRKPLERRTVKRK